MPEIKVFYDNNTPADHPATQSWIGNVPGIPNHPFTLEHLSFVSFPGNFGGNNVYGVSVNTNNGQASATITYQNNTFTIHGNHFIGTFNPNLKPPTYRIQCDFW